MNNIKRILTKKLENCNIYAIFFFYFIITSFVSFYRNPMTLFRGDPFTFFKTFQDGDALKFVTLAAKSLKEGFFISPVTHSPGLQVIDMILLWLHPKFPIITFLTFLNCLLWSILFTQFYFLGRQKLDSFISFFVPLILLIPYFSHNYFLRGAGIVLGTSYTAISINIGIIFILLALQQKRILLSVLAGIFFTFSGYIWSMADHILLYLSIIFFISTALYLFVTLILKKDNFINYLRHTTFFMIANVATAFTTFWVLTLPYRLHLKQLTMVPTNEFWQRFWRLPISSWSEIKTCTQSLIFRTGGFPFCQAYPDVCADLHKKVELHDNIPYLKQLAFQTFINNPLALITWKFRNICDCWRDYHMVQNSFIVFLFFLLVMLFFIKPTQRKTLITFFCCNIVFLTLFLLYLATLEERYFYIMKFSICVGFLLILYERFPSKQARTSAFA